MVILDTTFLIDLMRESRTGRCGPALRNLDELGVRSERPATTMLNVAELMVGPFVSDDGAKELERVNAILSKLDVLDFNYPSAVRYGKIIARSRLDGKPLGIADTLIASIALENDETLVTRDLSGFRGISGLRIESY